MYTHINSVTYDKEAQTVIIEGLDLDSLLLNDWDQEIASMNAEKIFRFDLKQAGHRVYLFKVANGKGDQNATSMVAKLNSLVGKDVSLNNGFIVKALG